MNLPQLLPQDSSTAVRPLGFGEVRMHLMHSLYSGTAQGAAVLKLRGNLDTARMRRAALQLQQNYEILNVSVEHLSDALWFCRRGKPSDALLTEVAREDSEHWLRLLESENSKELDYSQGLWRLLLLRAEPGQAQEHELILLAHHAVIDGLATAVIFEYLLSESTESAPVPTALEPRPIAPPAEHFSPFPLSWQDYEARQRKQAKSHAGFEPLPYRTNAPMAERRTRVIPVTPSLEASRRVIARAREAGVSVNSYLSAAFLFAIKALLPERRTTILHTAMSLRQMSAGRVSEADLGCYLSVISTAHEMTRSDLSLESLAKEHQSALLASAIASSRNPSEVDLAKFTSSMEPLARAQHFLLDFGMTFLDLPLRLQYPGLDVLGFYGAANRSIGSLAAVLQGIQLGERIFFTIAYTSPLQSTEWAEELARALLAELETPARSERHS
jgi:hypothetical protein